jgi:nucleoid DNA-binding protein
MSKSDLFSSLATMTGLSRKQVSAIFDTLIDEVAQGLDKNGPGAFVIPGLIKLRVVNKPAQPEREGINPFTKEPTVFKAKPARNVVKALPLKKLKEMV